MNLIQPISIENVLFGLCTFSLRRWLKLWYFLRIFSEKIQARRFHRDVAVGYEQQVHALEAEKDKDWRRSRHEIVYLNKAIEQLKNAEERYMAEEEDDATKTEELKRQLAIERRDKNEPQIRTGVVVVLGT